MGISATLVYESDCKYKKYGLLVYGVQLVFNFLWSMFFFLGTVCTVIWLADNSYPCGGGNDFAFL